MKGTKVKNLFLLMAGIVTFILVLGYFVKFTTTVLIAVWGVVILGYFTGAKTNRIGVNIRLCTSFLPY
jgi:hypothetical protein